MIYYILFFIVIIFFLIKKCLFDFNYDIIVDEEERAMSELEIMNLRPIKRRRAGSDSD